jgi:hypothetical protein
VLTGSGRVRAVVGLAILIALSAAGCGSHTSASPHNLPPLSVPRATTGPTNRPTASTNPAKISPEAAELMSVRAVVKRYYGLFNAPTTTHTSDQIAALEMPRCLCRAIVRTFRDAASKDEHFVGKGNLTAIRPEYDSSTRAGALVSFNSTKSGLVRSDGSYVDHLPAQRGVTQHLFLQLRNGQWRIQQVDLISHGR